MLKHSIKDVPRYFVPHTSDCFQNAYGAVVTHLGLNPDLILADYLSFMYEAETGYIGMNFLHKSSPSFEFTEEELNTSLEYAYLPAVTCFSMNREVELKEVPNDKIRICIYFEDNQETAHKRLKQLVNSGIPVVVVVDLYYMNYHRAYGKEHGAHAVVVTGYNEEEGYVELFDKYSLSSSDFDGRIPLDEFKLGRASENPVGSGSKPIRNMWMEISKSPNFFYNDQRWRSILEESCKRMLGEKDILGFKCGLNVIDSFRKDLLYKKSELPLEEVLRMYRHYYNYAFKIIARSRSRFGIFLMQLKGKLPERLIEEAVINLDESARKWEVISNVSLRLSLTKNINAIENLCSQLEQIRDNESRAVERLIRCSTVPEWGALELI